MKKIFSLFAAVLMAGSMMAGVLVEYNGTTTLPAGVTISGTTALKNVKIHTNTDGVDCIQLANGFTTDGVYNGNAIVLHTEGGFKTGDTLSVTGFFNNSSDTKVSKVALFTLGEGNACNGVWTSEQFINGRTSAEDPTAQTYVLAADLDSIMLGRQGDTGTNLMNIKVTRPETAPAPKADSEILYEFDTADGHTGSNNSYAGNCDVEINDITWNITGNAQMSPWRLGGKSISSAERTVYSKTAYPVALDSIILKLGLNTLASVDAIKLVYSTNADFSEAQEVVATVPAAFPATIHFEVAGGFPANCYYKFVIACSEASSNNKYIQFVGVEFWGVKPAAAVEKPVFDLAAGSYYDPQTIHLTCETEGVAFYYTTDGTTPTSASTLYMPAYGIVLSAGTTTTIKAIAYNNDSDNPAYSEVVEKTYTIATQYASLDELVAAGAPAGQKVVVTLTNETIDSLYVSSKGAVNGVYLTAGDRMVEIYCYNVPAEWAVGGTISGTVKGEWKEYNGTWEVCPTSWDGITYQAVLTFEVEAGTTTFTVTPSDLEVEYYISVIPAVDEDDVPYTKEVLVALIDGIIDDMGAGLEYFSGVQTQSYEEDWYVDEPGDYLILVCGINAGHSARTSDVILTPFTFSTATAIDNVEAVKATKTIENGNIVIIKNGIRYNAVGAKL